MQLAHEHCAAQISLLELKRAHVPGQIVPAASHLPARRIVEQAAQRVLLSSAIHDGCLRAGGQTGGPPGELACLSSSNMQAFLLLALHSATFGGRMHSE